MSCNTHIRSSRIGPITAASLLVLTAFSLIATPAKAEITDTDWSLKISEREMAFRPPTDAMAMKSLMWDIPSSRQAARNVPIICLTNDSATASISQFQMTIGDDKFHFANSLFGAYAKLGKDTPGFTLSSTVADGGDTLIVNFLNGGVAPGATVNFQFDIDVDAAFANAIYKHPDYRTVLFDMNGDNYYEGGGIENDISSDDNSKISLTFTMAGMPSVTTVPTPFVDPFVLDGSARYVNANIARYGDSDPVRSFGLSGGTAIPEPGSIMLGLVGLVSLCPLFGRSRRNSDGLR
jgi:hypothetical protein